MHWVWLSLSSPILCYRATVRIPVSVISLERKFHIACHGLQSITLVFIFLRPYYINLYVTFFFICLIIGVLLARGRRSVEDDTLPRRRGSLSDFIYDDSITCFVLFTYAFTYIYIYQISSIGCGPEASLSFPQPKQNKNGVAFRSVFGHVFSTRKAMRTSRVAMERSIDGRPRKVVGW